MNILFVTYAVYPGVTGRNTFLKNLKESLEARGHTVDILAHAPGFNEIYIVGGQRLNKSPLKHKVLSEIVPILQTTYPHHTPWIQWRETERYTFEEAIRMLDLSRYDIIHAHDLFSSFVCQRAIKDKPVLASFHNSKVEEWKLSKEQANKSAMELAYVAREEFLSANRPPKVIVPSKWLQDAFTRLSVPESKFNIVPYGMDIEEFQKNMRQPADIDKPKDKTVILCPARLVTYKGHTYSFQALERLKDEHLPFECWIAGSGALGAMLKQEVSGRNLDDVVRFLGTRQDIPALLALSDIVVLPTLHDTFPLVVMEAQIAGIPVIATMVGGIPEMIEAGKNGQIVPPRDANGMYHAILDLLRNPAKAKMMADEAKQASTRLWSIDRAARQTEDIYHELIETFQARDERSPYLEIDEELLEPIHEMSIETQPRLTGNISGTVCSQAGNPLTSATVHLMDITQVILKTEDCDHNGRFSFFEIPPGKYVVVAAQGELWNSSQLLVRESEVSLCDVNI